VAENLLSNSLKYSEQGQGPILVEFKRMDEWMVLTVEDRGIGIPAKQQRRLFEQFFRATNAKSREKFGTGLGLSIVREILQWHSGKVTVESEPKKGTRVETWWPLTLEEKK
jgi:signal transduction histidine kinase